MHCGKNIALNVKFTDLNKEYALIVENAVLHYEPVPVPNPNATLGMTKATLDDIQLGNITLDDARKQNKLTVDGQEAAFADFLGLLDTYNFWFNIVTP